MNDLNALSNADANTCDLLLILGSRLSDRPFCELAMKTDPRVPRFYVNNSRPDYDGTERRGSLKSILSLGNDDVTFNRDTDIVVTRFRLNFVIGDIINLLGWAEDINAIGEESGPPTNSLPISTAFLIEKDY